MATDLLVVAGGTWAEAGRAAREQGRERGSSPPAALHAQQTPRPAPRAARRPQAAIVESLQRYSAQIEGLKREMDEATEIAGDLARSLTLRDDG